MFLHCHNQFSFSHDLSLKQVSREIGGSFYVENPSSSIYRMIPCLKKWRLLSLLLLFHYSILLTEAVARKFSLKKVFLKISQNSQENNCAGVFFPKKVHIKKETSTQVFSCQFCKIFVEHLQWLHLY